MTMHPTPDWDCREPDLGKLLDGYIEGSLDDSARSAFEEHYFDCPGCLAEIRFRQTLGTALSGVAPRRLRWGLAAGLAGGLVAASLLWVALLPHRQPGLEDRGEPFSGPAVALTLETASRSDDAVPQAPVGRPLSLTLLAPLSSRSDAAYDVRIEGPGGAAVVAAAELERVEAYEIRVGVPRLPQTPGRYAVVLREVLPGSEVAREWRFTLELTASRSGP